ncbi:hypothetical protein [Dolichospermum circinale]|uniref:hypothetical protein n=1 Tax=Dolichospermum circinale TaxID=109265 RepID=UPI0023314681|nr:hypothetical protein [Dolichospermum circinale]MDB9456377.1 hypothetical protein [Dolichospermum circinale CS-541/06]MDB9461461.1 hypothetical protein [Dolichospermum circinale CS-541/04]MDB9547516.1 hypothetical protein [Dolichospermum circinale CS-1031]
MRYRTPTSPTSELLAAAQRLRPSHIPNKRSHFLHFQKRSPLTSPKSELTSQRLRYRTPTP